MSENGFEKLDRQIEDARQYAEFIRQNKQGNKTLLDVGSGVGLPGIIIALELEDFEVDLCEIRKKRASFLRIVVSQLKMPNVKIHTKDVKTIDIDNIRYITAQAVSDLAAIYGLTQRSHAKTVTVVSRKSNGWQEEIKNLEQKLDTSIYTQTIKKLEPHGTLVAIELAGGLHCLP